MTDTGQLDTGLPIRIGDVWSHCEYGECTVKEAQGETFEMQSVIADLPCAYMHPDARERGEWRFVRRDADPIIATCNEVRDMLLAKQEAYGNSALDPVRIFSRADPSDGLRVRIDDKLSRIARGSDAGEDTLLDLIGYLVLLRIATRTRSDTR